MERPEEGLVAGWMAGEEGVDVGLVGGEDCGGRRWGRFCGEGHYVQGG